MKTILAILAVAASIAVVHSQAPQAPVPAAAVEKAPLQQLQAIRDANLKLLEQQAKTLLDIAKMEEVAQQLKILGKRS
jgi:hypothetical protein